MTAEDRPVEAPAPDPRAWRDAALEIVLRLPSDDPDLPEAWGAVGLHSYALFLAERDEADLRLADRALSEALLAPPEDQDEWQVRRVVHAHVLACRHEFDAQRGRRGAAPWDAVAEAAAAGVAVLDGRPEYAVIAALARFLLAVVARARYAAAPSPEVLAAALAAQEEALGHQPEGTPDWVALHLGRAELLFERARAGGGTPDYHAAVHHQRAALSGLRTGPEQARVHHDLAAMLVVLGVLDNDGDALRQARDEFEAALARAGSASGEPPSWEWQARVFDVYVRAVLWRDWDEQAEAEIAAGRLDALLREPGAEDRMDAPFVEAFAQLRYDRAARDGDDAGRDAALAMLRRAVARWQPDHGSVGQAAIVLGFLELGRYQDDQDADRLAVVAEAARRVLDSGEETPLARSLAQVLRGFVDSGLVGPASGDGTATSLTDVRMDVEMPPLLEFLGEAMAEGHVTHDDAEVTGLGRELRRAVRGLRERGFEEWRRSEPGSAEHGKLARSLLAVLPLIDHDGTRFTREQRDALVAAAVATDRGEADPHVAHAITGMALAHDALTSGDERRWDEVLTHLDAASAAAPGDGGGLGRDIESLRSLARYHRGRHRGGLDDVGAGLAGLSSLPEMFDTERVSPAMRRGTAEETAAIQGLRAAEVGDLPAADRQLATVAEALAARAPQDARRIVLYTAHEMLRAARDALASRLGVPLAPLPPGGQLPPAEVLRAAARLPGFLRVWVLGDGGAARLTNALMTDDPGAVEESLKLLRAALELVDEGDHSWIRYAFVLGNALCALSVVDRSARRRAAWSEEGIAWLERLLARIGGPENSRLWFDAGRILGTLYRLRAEGKGRAGRDDRARARRALLSALRGGAWSVLSQSGTEHAAEAVGRASEVALQTAAWCLTDNVPAEAMTALDSCRGLILHAAMTSRSVAERLEAAGRRELAAEWRAAAAAGGGDGAVPSELRHRVLGQLNGPSGERQPRDRLLDPPSLAEIGAALRAVGRDALVYLVPALRPLPPPPGMLPRWSGTGALPWGAAVVVTADGRVRRVVLPRLLEEAEVLREYGPVAGTNRDLGPVGGAGAPTSGAPTHGVPFHERLDRLCRWAWDAAMRDVLAEFAPMRRARRRHPRLVLVPMGALAAVPWHAAWEPGVEGRRRYAFAEAEVSYAASARLLCEVAARPTVRHSGTALVVGDPRGDLAYAGVEAAAVHRAFYPGGTFLGGPAGTPDRVREWLRSPGGSGGVLHLACHATVAPSAATGGGRDSAHLSLHGGRVSAEDVVEAAAAELEVVVLAACRSHVSGRGHDEAFSLSTAFLAAGAGSVIGSLWPVPDDATSVLMFLTHHYLRRGGLPPGQALRRAQLWVVDPLRRPPPGMPPELAARAAHVDPDDLSAWAGFTHLGR
ncbi:CHAT domain-containing protein [Streptomyces hainanensis]|uniref:CHAT domain-containing protein n=1 Tax=Streptomyces hainanensis TaxID=402648 RepID=A0A4R4TD32_9ACTN|nr:CHAT domain-containing protein [Streptomyces hainanensis]TDC74056.1 CHAT domain-containing protein [Streptomyces hainanensis]